MTRKECERLQALLEKLMNEAPCKNGVCVGYQNCEYGIDGSYGGQCAIEIVDREAGYLQEKIFKKMLTGEI